MSETLAAMETACAIALAQLLAENPQLARLWSPEDSAVFRAGFVAGADYAIGALVEEIRK